MTLQREKLIRRLGGILFCLVFILNSACSAGLIPAETATPPATLTPDQPTATFTATPIWFPVTATPTPRPSPTLRPTQDDKPALGELLLQDDFNDPELWQTGTTSTGKIALGKNEMSLSVTAARGVQTSLREGALPADSYLELTVYPSLCSGEDVYGVLFRASSNRDGYRLAATCDGRLRLERLKNSELAILQDWLPSGAVPRGGMVPVVFGIWTSGKEIRVFANQSYQFSVHDPVWQEGQVGAYIRAAQAGPLTVNFSQLRVYAVDRQRLPTPTLPPSPTPTR